MYPTIRGRVLFLAGVLLIAVAQAGGAGVSTPAELERSIQRGVEFLVKDQNQDGSWGTAQNTKDLNILAPVPEGHQAFRAAVTALSVEALIETGAADHDARVRQAIAQGEEWLLENLAGLRRSDPKVMYNIWGHAYGIQALVDMARRETGDTKRAKRIRGVIRSQVDFLRRFESVDGGWGYLDTKFSSQRPASTSLPFCTATVLVALHQAKQLGVDVPDDLVRRALASIQRQRKPDNTYLYGEMWKNHQVSQINLPAGSLGRSQVCNLALRAWGDKTITQKVTTEWLDRLIERNGWLSIGRKRPIPHESWFHIAGYFYYYGHYYAALSLRELSPDCALKYQDGLASLLMPLQEEDGSWWDFPLYNYHKQYGTAFAVMSLVYCRKPLPAP